MNDMLEHEDDVYSYIQKGNNLRSKGKLDEAIQKYEFASKLNPSHHLPLIHLGITYANQENFQKASYYHQKSIEVSAKHPRLQSLAYFHLGSTLAQQGHIDQSINSYKASSNLNPSFSDSFREHAELLAKKNRLDEALVLAKKAQSIDPNNYLSTWTAQNIEVRKFNTTLLENSPIKIVSLGSDCLPRTVLTRWGIKPNKVQGELSCPFDLAAFSYHGVLRVLENDFEDLVTPSLLETISKPSAHFGIPIPTNQKYACSFNHERGDRWIRDNYKELVIRYKQRIDNFYLYIESFPILFVYHDRRGNFSSKMVELLHQKFGHTLYKLLVLNTSGIKYSFSQAQLAQTTVFDIPFPSHDYGWSLARYYKSPVGMEFENKIQLKVKELLLDDKTPQKLSTPTQNTSRTPEKKIVFFGNCQAFALKSLLSLSLGRNDKINLEVLSNNARTGDFSGSEEILSKVENADIIIYQPLGKHHGDLSEDSIKSKASSHAQLVSFPYIFNSGMYSLGHAPLATKNSYGQIYGESIIKSLLEKYGIEKVLELYKRGEIDFNLQERFNKCINELAKREINTDIKISDFILEFFKHKKLFLTHNHPTTFVFSEVCRQINQLIDCPFDLSLIDINILNQANLSQTNTPISPYDISIHGYQFPEHSDWFYQGKELILTINESLCLVP